MALPPALATELRSALSALRAAHGASAVPDGAGKALEAWLLMKLAETAQNSGTWAVSLRQGDGTPLPTGADFKLPAQPRAIAAANPTASGFILIERQDQRLELHGGLQWMGRSGARHEWDISVIPAEIEEALRTSGGATPMVCRSSGSNAKTKRRAVHPMKCDKP